MKPANCRKCGKVFMYAEIGLCLCPVCKQAENEALRKIREYMKAHKDVTDIPTIATALNMNANTIIKYIYDKKLVLEHDWGIQAHCDICGERIYTGRICERCQMSNKRQLTDALAQARLQNQKRFFPEQEPAMRFMTRNSTFNAMTRTKT